MAGAVGASWSGRALVLFIGVPVLASSVLQQEAAAFLSEPHAQEQVMAEPQAAPTPRVATASFIPGIRSAVAGRVMFTQTELGVRIEIALHDAPPGVRGVHIHESSDCRDFAARAWVRTLRRA